MDQCDCRACSATFLPEDLNIIRTLWSNFKNGATSRSLREDDPSLDSHFMHIFGLIALDWAGLQHRYIVPDSDDESSYIPTSDESSFNDEIMYDNPYEAELDELLSDLQGEEEYTSSSEYTCSEDDLF